MTTITSRDNQKLKFARSVRDGREKGFVFVEGARLAREVARSGSEITEIFVSESFQEKNPERETGNATIVADRLFTSIADTNNPQGIILIAKRPGSSIDLLTQALESATVPTIVFLNEINNPSNLGAIFRTVEASGAAGVMVSANSADAFSPKAARSAMGASFRIPVYENAALDEAAAWARKNGLKVTVADIDGTVSYTDIDWKRPRLLIFGSEAHGLEEGKRGNIEEIVYIPMENDVESLNLAVACGIVLFEAKRYQRL